MTHAPVALGSTSRARRRAGARAVPANEALRPARGIMLGLGLSSLIWTALIALIAL